MIYIIYYSHLKSSNDLKADALTININGLPGFTLPSIKFPLHSSSFHELLHICFMCLEKLEAFWSTPLRSMAILVSTNLET